MGCNGRARNACLCMSRRCQQRRKMNHQLYMSTLAGSIRRHRRANGTASAFRASTFGRWDLQTCCQYAATNTRSHTHTHTHTHRHRDRDTQTHKHAQPSIETATHKRRQARRRRTTALIFGGCASLRHCGPCFTLLLEIRDPRDPLSYRRLGGRLL